MTKLPKESAIEASTGNVLTSAAINAVTVYLGGPLAAMIPSLFSSLAARRHQERIASAIKDISVSLAKHEEQISNLSDEQYKLANELYLTLLQTTHSAKIAYLKTAIEQTVKQPDFSAQEATLLSRIIRDISVEEVDFLRRIFHFRHVCMIAPSSNSASDIYCVAHDGKESILVSGLAALGILVSGTVTLSGGANLYFSTITAKLLAMLEA